MDFAPGAQAILGHCEVWTAKFTGLLNTLAQRELVDVAEYMRASTAALQQQPLQNARQVWRRPPDVREDCTGSALSWSIACSCPEVVQTSLPRTGIPDLWAWKCHLCWGVSHASLQLLCTNHTCTACMAMW